MARFVLFSPAFNAQFCVALRMMLKVQELSSDWELKQQDRNDAAYGLARSLKRLRVHRILDIYIIYKVITPVSLVSI